MKSEKCIFIVKRGFFFGINSCYDWEKSLFA